MKTERRRKRTKSEVEEEIIKVALSIMEEKGFNGITLTGIAKAAQVEPSVFYNRFNTLDHCLDEVVKKYDYWFSGIIQNYKGNIYTEDGYRYIFNELFSSLSDNKMMQQLLSWELSTKNETTVRTASLREFHTIPLARKFHELFKDKSIDIRAISALLVGGIYYLVLHRGLTTSNEIDINTQIGKERIINAINYLARKLFSELEPDNDKMEIARKLKKKHVEILVISECTGLPISIIESL